MRWLQEVHGLSDAQARASAGAHLPEGYGRFGLTATTKLIAALEEEVIVYSDAVVKAGFGHHSDLRQGHAFDKLPYYGVALERHIMPGTGDPNDENEETRIGRLTNPTVHIGLNQLRRVVNRLIARYKKPPEQIVIELARDLKLDEERKGEIRARNRDNRKAAEKRSEKLRDIGQRDTGRNRVLLKLWEELNPDNPLDRRCVYTGQRISIGMLFSDEGLVDIDHILPFGVTLDNSDANRLLCTSEANKLKRKRSPSEAFGPGSGNTRYPWDEIVERANRLPDEKRWRFGPRGDEAFRQEWRLSRAPARRHAIPVPTRAGIPRHALPRERRGQRPRLGLSRPSHGNAAPELGAEQHPAGPQSRRRCRPAEEALQRSRSSDSTSETRSRRGGSIALQRSRSSDSSDKLRR